MQTSVVIAGAGPAGLACARAIATGQPGTDVLLLEAGRSYRRRPCPVDRGLRCTGCGGVCNVISGFGGAMHYGDGIKLSLLPSGRRLIDHFGRGRAHELCDRAFDWLTEPLDAKPNPYKQRVSPETAKSFATHGLEIREYPVAVIGESELRQIIAGWHDRLGPAVTLWDRAELVDAQPKGDGLTCTVRTHTGLTTVDTQHLVLATGRRGVTSTADLLRRLGVPMTDPDISVGVRFEMNADLLRAIGLEHPDLKISQFQDTGVNKVKTFCFCGGVNGGRIKFTHYQGSFGDPVITLDGHETMERPVGTRPLAANFGLLSQATGRGGAHEARESFLTAYRKLAGGRPFVQTLRAFLSRSNDAEEWAAVEARMPFQPSVRDLQTGRVDQLFTLGEYASLTAGFERLMPSILDHSGHSADLESLLDAVLVVAPELEFLWEKPQLNGGCQVPGLPVHVVGDAAGIAQGIVQGAMMGVAAGQAIAR